MDNRENRAAASFEVRAVDDVTVSVEGYAAVINLTTNLFILVDSVAEKSEANAEHWKRRTDPTVLLREKIEMRITSAI